MAKSNQALAAQMIRKELKALGIAARVTSKGYSMGDSVNVDLLNDPRPEVVAQVKELTAKYEYGHFNGMEDIYEYSNTRDDIPQTKYLFVNTNYSDEIREKARVFCSNYYHEDCDHSSLVHQTLNGSADNGFWDASPVPAEVEEERDEWAELLNAGVQF